MSLAAHITAQLRPLVRCRTCTVLAQMSDEDRADFAAAVGTYPGSVIARALTTRLTELGREDTVEEGSVRKHIRDGHDDSPR